jgi:hypothetical protein
MRRRLSLASAALLVACSAPPREPTLPPAPSAPDPTLLSDEAFADEAFVRTRASTDPDVETFTWWQGSIHELRTDQPTTSRAALLGFEGFNVARVLRDEDGSWSVLSREITVYTDPDGAILDCWTDQDDSRHPVVHVQNDPVNFTLRAPAWALHDDRVLWSLTIPLAYPSPLPTADFPAASAEDTYRSVEQFTFEVALADLADPSLASVPSRIVWSRMGQWLPWMGRGQQPGWLVYQATGRKLMGGWDELPASLRAWTEAHAPAYRHAPEADEEPNQTSWSVYRARVEAGAIRDGCEPLDATARGSTPAK